MIHPPQDPRLDGLNEPWLEHRKQLWLLATELSHAWGALQSPFIYTQLESQGPVQALTFQLAGKSTTLLSGKSLANTPTRAAVRCEEEVEAHGL